MQPAILDKSIEITNQQSQKDRFNKIKRISILRYWIKKNRCKKLLPEDQTYRVKYTKRKKLADKRLRINGKFVSKKQAITQLGMTKKQFAKEVKKQAKKQMDLKIQAKNNKRIDAEVICGNNNQAIKVGNAQQLIKTQKRGRIKK